MFDKVILSEKVAESIKKLIRDKKLQSGDKLPNEIELTKTLNVSRSTIREAIKTLVSKNILEVKRGKGTFVSNMPGLVKDPLGVSLMNKEDLLYFLFETRLIIEPEIAALSAERICKNHIIELEKSLQKMKEKIIMGEDHTEWDKKFHNIIAVSTGNPIMQRIIPIIKDSITEGYIETKEIPESGNIVIKNHEKLLLAIKKKQKNAAREHMKDVILYGMNNIKSKKFD